MEKVWIKRRENSEIDDEILLWDTAQHVAYNEKEDCFDFEIHKGKIIKIDPKEVYIVDKCTFLDKPIQIIFEDMLQRQAFNKFMMNTKE